MPQRRKRGCVDYNSKSHLSQINYKDKGQTKKLRFLWNKDA